jgi:hypothetical protein
MSASVKAVRFVKALQDETRGNNAMMVEKDYFFKKINFDGDREKNSTLLYMTEKKWVRFILDYIVITSKGLEAAEYNG